MARGNPGIWKCDDLRMVGFTSPDIAGMAGWLIGALALTIFGYIVLRSIKPNIGNGE
jgi:hypothetical protein